MSADLKVRVLRHWMHGRKNGVGVVGLIGRMLALSPAGRGRLRIRRMDSGSASDDGGSYMIVHLRGVERPLYWPAEMSQTDLCAVLSECCCRDDWHYYEIPQTRVAPDDTVLDCGAAEGAFSLRVQPRCRQVFCAEPLPAFVRSLRMTFASCDNVKILPVALADMNAVAFLHPNGGASRIWCDSPESIRVRVRTIDSLFPSTPITYMKVDVEGCELPLLIGAEQTIRRCRPRMAIAAYHRDEDAERLSKFVVGLNLGYKILLKGVWPTGGRPVLLHAWPD